MEKHRCKLCFRKFANGRALGGHMRCHMMNLPIPPKPKPPPTAANNNCHPSCEAPSSSTSSDSDHHDEEIPDDCFHPRLADHDSSSLISTLQDRESENESFKKKNNTTTTAAAAATKRRRSKRIVTHKPSSYSSTYCSDYLHEKQHYKKCRVVVADDDDDKKKMNDDNNVNDMVEPVSCTSEVTSDEDLAFCLMMMSRDNWSSKFTKHDDGDADADHDDDDDDDDDGDNMVIDDSSTRSKKKYKCETCDKVFRSYQALGGHRASHKKLRVCENEVHQSCNFGSKEDDKLMEDESVLLQKKVHECPVCFRVFSSGQALGGHKRSHVLATGNNINGVEKSSPANKNKMMMMVISSSSCHNSDSFIDLNLPAPVEDEEEISDDQIAVSAVSDVHF